MWRILLPAFRRFARLAAELPDRALTWWVFGLSAVLLEARIMLPDPVGLADNSDGRRLICQFGAAPPGGWRDAVFWWHTQLSYVPSTAGCEHAYQSSQLLLLWPTSWLTRLFFHDRILDLRFLGGITVMLLAGAVALIFAAAPGSRRLRLLCATGLIAILADPEFADFIMSPYSESAVLVGALYVVAAVLLMRGAGRTGRAGVALFVVACAFMLCAKTQTLTVALPLALLLFLIRIPGDERASRARQIAARVGLLAAIGGIVAAYPPKATPGGLSAQTRFNLVFTEILRTDNHPAADLKALGYPAAATKFEGENAWCTLLLHPHDPLAQEVQGTATYSALARFFLAHPDTALRVMQRAAKRGFFQPQPTASFCNWPDHRLGDYPLSVTKGTKFDGRFNFVDWALRLLRPGGLPLLCAGWTALGALALFARRRSRLRLPANLLIFFVATSAVQFATAAFGDGLDVTKHLNLSVFCAAAAGVLATTIAVDLVRERKAGRPGPLSGRGREDDDMSASKAANAGDGPFHPEPAGAN